jgi:hypothetical protein
VSIDRLGSLNAQMPAICKELGGDFLQKIAMFPMGFVTVALAWTRPRDMR